MDMWFGLKKKSKLNIADSFPLIMSHICMGNTSCIAVQETSICRCLSIHDNGALHTGTETRFTESGSLIQIQCVRRLHALHCWTGSHVLPRNTVTQHSIQLESGLRSCGGKVVFASRSPMRIGSRFMVQCGDSHRKSESTITVCKAEFILEREAFFYRFVACAFPFLRYTISNTTSKGIPWVEKMCNVKRVSCSWHRIVWKCTAWAFYLKLCRGKCYSLLHSGEKMLAFEYGFSLRSHSGNVVCITSSSQWLKCDVAAIMCAYYTFNKIGFNAGFERNI